MLATGARLGRLHRLSAKFRPPAHVMSTADASQHVALAEAAFNHALALNPDSALADSYSAQLELDLGRSKEALVRLVRRAATRSGDAERFPPSFPPADTSGFFNPRSRPMSERGLPDKSRAGRADGRHVIKVARQPCATRRFLAAV